MKILQINKFFYLKGGPERYIFNVSSLLKNKGHEVAFFSMHHDNNLDSQWTQYFVDNVDYNKKHNLFEKLRIFKNTLYSTEATANLTKLLDVFKPDVCHIHNFNHQLTPSILHAIRKKNIPIVLTLHDYKLACPSYSMFNRGKICELCKNGRFYHCFATKCHKNSFSKSLLATIESYLHHQLLKSYKNIQNFICPSVFMMKKLKNMGLKGNFVHLPNFIDSATLTPLAETQKNKLIYCGRLSSEKGIVTLIEAAKELPIKLEIIGDGPLKKDIEEKIIEDNITNIMLTGYLNGNELFTRLNDCFAVIVPSEWYENNPFSILEAFALGKPVIGSRIGGIPELVKHGETGLLFESGNIEDLRNKIEQILIDPDKTSQMGKNARKFIEDDYNSEKHYRKLMEIYEEAKN